MRVPCATFRVQFNKDFQFNDAEALLPFLQALGITDLYASPIFQARKGSTHGYDVTDPSRLNFELGSDQDFESLSRALQQYGMGLLLDIVPNHMAASPENPWWLDVLENGSASPFAAFFDVEWRDPSAPLNDKIYLPILGEPYGAVLEDKKLQLSLDPEGFRVNYYAFKLPLDPATYHEILSSNLEQFLTTLNGTYPGLEEFGKVLEGLDRLPARSVTEWEGIEARIREIPDLKTRLWTLYSQDQRIRDFIDQNIYRFNGVRGNPASFDLLHNLLEKQAFQLTYWKVAREKVNYRRFFDVSDLIGLRAEDPEVFEQTHALTLRLLAEGKVNGLRIDHIDGLYDPVAYLEQLQAKASQKAGREVFISVEKILCGEERLCKSWPVAGTTGYDFLGITNNLFVHPDGLMKLTETYENYIGASTSFEELAYIQRRRVIQELFAGEISALSRRLTELAEKDRYARDLSPAELERALIEVSASLPVYRTYTRSAHASRQGIEFIQRALSDARARNPQLAQACFDFVERVLLVDLPQPEEALRFTMRWQQLTGPVMAKGVEDTTLYRYNRLISMNDVGGNPSATSLATFHAFNLYRREQWPDTMNATSTHDTKRSEDVRARINLLSEMPDPWSKLLKRWTRWNKSKKPIVDGNPAPDPNDEYLLYQTMLGAWPLRTEKQSAFHERLKKYLLKAVREAKRISSWLKPNSAYEAGLQSFVDRILDEQESSQFLDSFRTFQNRIAFYGAINSLSQTLLKICCPGIPDFYQRTSMWDFSLVDPDNRRSPTPPEQVHVLESLSESGTQPLLECWRDGRVKSFLILKGLGFRRDHSDLFRSGEYLPLDGTELAAEHSISFARRHGDVWALAVAPRFVSDFSTLEKMPVGRRIWGNSAIRLPAYAPRSWSNIFTGEEVRPRDVEGLQVLAMSDILKNFPVALLSATT